jgi:hypothetical protein
LGRYIDRHHKRRSDDRNVAGCRHSSAPRRSGAPVAGRNRRPRRGVAYLTRENREQQKS